MTQWFYVLTGGGIGSEQLLWANAPADLGADDSGLNGAIVYMKYASADWTPHSVPPLSQMWQLNFDGTIVSALSPNYVLGLSGTNAVLVERSSSDDDPSQQWDFQWVRNSQDVMLGTLRNKGNQQYLTGSGDWSWAAISTTAMPVSGPTDLMLWYVRPTSPPTGQALTIRSVGATADDSGSMVVNIQGSSLDPGTTTILYPMQPNSPNSIWTYTPEGFLLSAINPGLALSYDRNADVGGGSENGVATYPILPPATGPNMQQWSFTTVDPRLGTYLIVNQAGMQALAISGTSASDALQLVSPDPTDPAQLWTVSPTYPLEVLLAQPLMGYPAFAGEEAMAYAYINAQLGLTSLGTELRSQYANLAAPLTGYQSRINMLTTALALQQMRNTGVVPGDGPNIDAMLVVAGMLSEELTAAQAVQQLFQQLTIFHSELAIVTTNATAAIIADAAIDTQSTQTVQMSSAAIIEGLIYTLVSMGSTLTEFGSVSKGIGLLMPVIANMYQTGVSTVNSYRQSKAQSAQRQTAEKIFYDFEGKVAEVQQFLADSFTAIGNALAATESVILGDSFKTRAVAAMAALPSGGNSLFWPPNQGLSLIPLIVPGYEIGVLQTLLPTKYQIYTGTWIQGSWQSNQSDIGVPPSGAPSYCIWDDQINSSVEASTVYWIASVASHDAGYPGQATMDFLSKRSSVRWFNFYRRLAGWNGFASGEKFLTDNQTILLFRNYTSATLTISIDANDAQVGLNGQGSMSLTLPPFGYQSAVLFSVKGAGSDHQPDATVNVMTPDGTSVWKADNVGWKPCSNVYCPGTDFAIYPYCPDNVPVTFSSSVTTGAGGSEIGIARPASEA